MPNVEIKVSGLKELEKKLDGLQGEQLISQMKRTMYVATTTLKTKARELVPVFRGALKRSIREDVEYSNKTVEGIVQATEPYAKGVEFGTKPHAVSAVALSRWAKSKGINPYALAKSIARKGTRAQPFMVPAFEQSKKKIIKIFQDTINYLLEQ